ncbi:DUF3349 domain-containing protein [Janthinobacterium tructae]|uniref:DUF3349 domain-containing protein n=1 Tax=Janthinobacterium tructae TaxID=2590869 RepID=UPI00143E0610|nr:DUF3349 domain-containing protein [Janthinobacterium tructae]
MNMPDALPPTLSGAARMLHSAYPGGMPETAYAPVLALLYEHFSDRNLSELMAAVTGKDAAAVLNDIYACASSKPEASAIATARRLLERHGLQAICAEE